MRKLLAVVGVMMLAAIAATASDQTDAMASVRRFVDGFNKGDMKSGLAACADQASVIDDFPPFHWNGPGACGDWAKAYDDWAKANGVTEGVVSLGKTRHIAVVGDTAYVVMIAGFNYKDHGKPKRESGATFTFVLHKNGSGWLITAWTWSAAEV
jgi:ketosteroid isomerase-like protein